MRWAARKQYAAFRRGVPLAWLIVRSQSRHVALRALHLTSTATRGTMTDWSVMSDATTPAPTAVLDLRHRLLAAAEQVCALEGLYDARIEDVTRIAGVAKGTFYLYFSSKEAIVLAVVQEAFLELGERCRAAVVRSRARSQRAVCLATAHLAFYEQRPGRMRLLHQARGVLKFSKPEWLPLRRALEAHLDLVARLLDLPASFAATDRRNAARMLFGTTAGLASVFATTADDGARGRLPADCHELVARMLLDYIATRRRRAARRTVR